MRSPGGTIRRWKGHIAVRSGTVNRLTLSTNHIQRLKDHIMTLIRRSIITAALIALASLASFLSPNVARAQCPVSITVFNNMACPIRLVIYDVSGTQTVTFNLPPNAATVCNNPGGFVSQGIVSAGNNRYAFPNGGGCLPCLAFPVIGGGTCCAQACSNPANCTMTINPCGAGATCAP
ncbi:MAG: hypothetical protein JWQ98_672 [Chlorobi bacterium]|nr:hypothetical protein [Chlorobiota bacterium]